MAIRDDIRETQRLARLLRGRQHTASGALMRWNCLDKVVDFSRAQDSVGRFYARLTCQQYASVSDRKFYVVRARKIRLSGYKTIHP